MSKKKALVAGGAGFIGSHLCEYLLSKNYDVHALDNLVTGRKENIQHLIVKGLQFHQLNLIEPFDLNVTFDEIYNLASPASPVDFAKMPLFILQTSSVGHLRLLDLAKKMNARILIASTSEVYGDPIEHPQTEEYWGNVNPIGPRSCYDEAKRFAEALSMAHFRTEKTQIRIIRIFNTYGPRMRPDDGRIIPNFFMQALKKQPLTIYGDGTQTRSFCYVSDMVEGMYALMQSMVTTPVNIGNPSEKSVAEIADEINRLTGNTQEHIFLPLPEDDPRRRWPQIDKAKKLLKWEPRVDLAEGLEKTLAFFKTI
ncbi:MAG: UDP-glucuronic acid decarboxylase family protein [Bdellovibrionales bacterium]